MIWNPLIYIVTSITTQMQQQTTTKFTIHHFNTFFFWKKLFAIAIPFLSFRRKISYFFVFIQFIYFDHNMICYFFHIVNKILLLIIKSKRKTAAVIVFIWFDLLHLINFSNFRKVIMISTAQNLLCDQFVSVFFISQSS